MSAPIFLTVDDVIAIHRDQIQRYGGSLGVRDAGMLASAVAAASAGFGGQYLHVTLEEMAAAYAFHLIQNHPFVDGNKRVGTSSAITFLKANGVEVDVDEMLLADFMLAVARGEKDKAEITAFFQGHRKP